MASFRPKSKHRPPSSALGDDPEPDRGERAAGDAAMLGGVHVPGHRDAARVVRQVPGDVAVEKGGAVDVAQVEALGDRPMHRAGGAELTRDLAAPAADLEDALPARAARRSGS